MSKKIVVEVDLFLKDIVPKFLSARREDMGTLSTLLANQSWAEIQSLAHKIKGNAGSYGLTELGKLGGELEAACKAQNVQLAPGLIEKMQEYVKNVEVVFVNKKDDDEDEDDED